MIIPKRILLGWHATTGLANGPHANKRECTPIDDYLPAVSNHYSEIGLFGPFTLAPKAFGAHSERN
jgi:hypothetical protein